MADDYGGLTPEEAEAIRNQARQGGGASDAYGSGTTYSGGGYSPTGGGGGMAYTDDADLTNQLISAGYNGPWDHDSMVAAWGRANSGGSSGGGYGGGGSVIGGSDYLSWAGNQAQQQAYQQYLRDRLAQIEVPDLALKRDALTWDQTRWGRQNDWDQQQAAIKAAMDTWQQRQSQALRAGELTGGYAPPPDEPDLPYRFKADQFVRDYMYRYPGQRPPNELLDQLFPMLPGTGPGVTPLPQLTADKQRQADAVRAQIEARLGKKLSDAQWRTAVTGRLDPADPAVLSGEARAGQPLTDFTQRAQNPWRIPGLDLLANLPAEYKDWVQQRTPPAAPSAPSQGGAPSTPGAAPSAPPTADPYAGWQPPPDFNPPPTFEPPADWGWPSDWRQRAKGGQVSMSSQGQAPAVTEGGTMKIQGFPTGQQPGGRSYSSAGQTEPDYTGANDLLWRQDGADRPWRQQQPWQRGLAQGAAGAQGTPGGSSPTSPYGAGQNEPYFGTTGASMPWQQGGASASGYSPAGVPNVRILGQSSSNGAPPGGGAGTPEAWRQGLMESAPGQSGGPTPYGQTKQLVYNPLLGQWEERTLDLRQQDLADWQAQREDEYRRAALLQNPANYALAAALQGKAPWQRGMAQAPTQQPDMSIQPVGNSPDMRALSNRYSGTTVGMNPADRPEINAASLVGSGGISSQVGQQQPSLNQRWGVPTPREMNAQQLLRMRPDERQAFGSAVRATGRSPEDWEQEQRTYTPQRASYAKARW